MTINGLIWRPGHCNGKLIASPGSYTSIILRSWNESRFNAAAKSTAIVGR